MDLRGAHIMSSHEPALLTVFSSGFDCIVSHFYHFFTEYHISKYFLSFSCNILYAIHIYVPSFMPVAAKMSKVSHRDISIYTNCFQTQRGVLNICHIGPKLYVSGRNKKRRAIDTIYCWTMTCLCNHHIGNMCKHLRFWADDHSAKV